MMPVASSRLGAIRATYKGAAAPAGAASVRSDLVQIAPLDEGHSIRGEKVGRCFASSPILTPLVGDLDLGALRAKRAKGELDQFHLDVLLAGPVQVVQEP